MINILSIFLYIGSISFGGGWAVVGLIKEIMISQNYLTLVEFKEIITAAQLTPGPIAVNMATYIGYKYYGLLGALLNTLFLLFPSIMIVISYSHFKNSIKVNKIALMNSLILGTSLLVFITLYTLGIEFFLDLNIRAILLTIMVLVLLVKTKIDPIFFIIGTGLIAIIIL